MKERKLIKTIFPESCSLQPSSGRLGSSCWPQLPSCPGCLGAAHPGVIPMLSPSCSQCPAKLAKSNLASVPHPQGRSWGRSLYCDHHPLEPATLDKGSTVEKMRGTKVCESCWDGGKLCASADVLLLTRASTVSQNSSSLVHGPPGLDGGGHGVQSTISRAGLTPLLLGHELHSHPCRRQSPPAPTSAAVLRLS